VVHLVQIHVYAPPRETFSLYRYFFGAGTVFLFLYVYQRLTTVPLVR